MIFSLFLACSEPTYTIPSDYTPPPKTEAENATPDSREDFPSIENAEGSEPPLNENPDFTSAPDEECMISHSWKDLRKDSVPKIRLKTKLSNPEPVQFLVADFISNTSGEVVLGISCPSSTIDLDIPADLGKV